MNIGVIGCGNVGFAFLSWLDGQGYTVKGYDINSRVQERIKTCLGEDCLALSVNDLRFCEGIFICVPTEPSADGSADMTIFESVIRNLKTVSFEKEVAIIQRSTCIPGSAKKYSCEFSEKVSYAVNPSFLRKSSIEYDTAHPDRIAIGGTGFAKELLEQIYSDVIAPRFVTDDATCVELLKYIENSMDSLLISYWNEIATYSKTIGISEDDFIFLLEHFCDKEKFKSTVRIPGQAFGLWCLPKDLQAFIVEMRRRGIPSSVLDGVQDVNKRFAMIEGVGEIPAQELIEFDNGRVTLLKKGIEQVESFWKR